MKCQACNGDGFVDDHLCRVCIGTGEAPTYQPPAPTEEIIPLVPEPDPEPIPEPEPPQPSKPTQDDLFRKYLPDTLYYSHYTLAKEIFPEYEYTPEQWRKYIRENQVFIDAELAAIAEAEARSALQKLSSASGQEVSALKTLLEKSKLINEAQRQATKVVITYLPATKPKERMKTDG